MNKISKKIVALVTMAAFVLTLVPATAFAAESPKNAVVDASYYGTTDDNVEAATYEDVVTTFDVADKSGAPVSGETDNGLTNIMVWATLEGESTPSSAATFYNYTNGEVGAALRSASTQSNSYATDVEVKDGYQVAVDFARPGTYVLHAAQVTTNSKNETVITEFKYDTDNQKIVVNASDVSYITVNGTPVTDGKCDLTADSVYANNTEKKTVDVVAYAKQDENVTVAANKEFTIDDNSAYVTVSKDTVTTDRQGKFSFTYSASKAGTYVITLKSEDGYEAKLTIKAVSNDQKYAATIEGTSEDVTLNIDGGYTDFSDAIQFTIKDQNGDVMTGQDAVNGQPAADPTAENRADYVSFVGDAPKGFKGEAKDFRLYYDSDDDVVTLKYDGKAELVAGEYNLRVALYRTGDWADVTLKLGEFDEDNVTDIKVVPTSDRVAYNAGSISYKVIAVDKNGVESNITDENGTSYYLGLNATASDYIKFGTPSVSDGKGTVSVIVAGEKDNVIGSVIQLTAVSEKYEDIATADITITDVDVVEGLAFDKDNGKANEDNTVKVSVVDADGNVVDVDGKVKAYVASSSNEKANVEVTAGNDVVDGKNGTLTVFADQPTTLEIVVAVVDTGNSDNTKVYADTLTYTVGEKDVNADKIVAMTIGSTDMIVNNELVNGDAAPYVADGRTMVPIRALTETFGAEVNYDNDARTVTIVDGDTTIVMTIGETTYTVNGEEQTMDVAPVIGSGDRTYVPVRFVAEALGYKVTPLYAADNTTASVVFQK